MIKCNDHKYKWVLVAQNIQGACVEYKADTKKAVLNAFDSVYWRKGFKIKINLNVPYSPDIIIKSTFN